jgi:hypothetical protein
VGTDDARAPDGGAEQRYRLALGRAAQEAEWARADPLLPGLVKTLGLLNGGLGPLDVRLVPKGGLPVMRADLWAEDAERLTWLFTRYPVDGGPGADVLGAAAEYSAPTDAGRGRQAVADSDVAEMNPGWYALDLDVEFFAGLRQARAAARALEAEIRRILPSRLVVGWDAWQDGRGVVRLDLEPAEAARFTVIVDYLVEQAGPELGGCG